MCYREIRARERVWERAQKETRFQWACVMEGLYLEAKRMDGSRFTKWDWLPAEDRPSGSELAISPKEWKTVEEAHAMMRHQSMRDQKAALAQMLSFSAEYNMARQGQ